MEKPSVILSLSDNFGKTREIAANAGTVREQLLKDAADNGKGEELNYIKEAAEHGCIGGNCQNLIYYSDTHDFYAKYADEIDELLANCDYLPNLNEGNGGRITGGDLRNFLAWWAYEYEAQKVMTELESDNQ